MKERESDIQHREVQGNVQEHISSVNPALNKERFTLPRNSKKLLGERKNKTIAAPARARLTLNLPHCVSGFDLFKLACMCKVLLFKYIKTSDAVGVFAQRLVYLKTERQKPPESKRPNGTANLPFRTISLHYKKTVCVRVRACVCLW